MTIEAVIGANYGDEGKGLFTEYLCRNRNNPLVVMSNGGCQRGHTVINAERNIRHVFHHFGSGTLVGAPTLCSRTFLMNPIAFAKEHDELCHLGVMPNAHRMHGCTLQLPSDMFINQQLEKHRNMSSKRHGSCGWGIWETKVRNASFKRLIVEDFLEMSLEDKRKCMNESLEWQIENRLKCEDGLEIDFKTFDIVRSDNFVNHFIEDFFFMIEQCSCIEDPNAVIFAENAGIKTIVVENAQGLLLDEKYAPVDENGRTDIHVTPSMTGLEGALASLGADVDFNIVTPNYVSRSYMTRHGEGPFPEETPGMKFIDKTNVTNEYQGSMRFGKIDYDISKRIFERIHADAHSCSCVPRLVVTHLNEMRCIHLEENANWTSFEDDSSKIKEKTLS